MGTISVLRTDDLSPQEGEQLSLLLSNKFTGASEKDTNGWLKWPKWLMKREIGEIFEISIKKIRHGKFHRKHMLLEQTVFDAQERFTDFDRFRDWIKIGAGFCVWEPGAKGGIVPLPKSIAYDKCEQDEYEDFHGSVIDFFLTEHCQKFLWRHLSPGQRSEMMDTLIGKFVVDWWNVQEAREQAKEANAAQETAKPPTQHIYPPSINDGAVGTPGAAVVEMAEAAT
jgi:hypothetical protein